MPSPKKSVSPKKKTVSRPKSSPKKTVSRPKSSPKKMTTSSKPKLTDTHKAIAAASLLALLGGGAVAYSRNKATIDGKSKDAYDSIKKAPAAVRAWLDERPQKVKDAYNKYIGTLKKPWFIGGGSKNAADELKKTDDLTLEQKNAVKAAVNATPGTTPTAV